MRRAPINEQEQGEIAKAKARRAKIYRLLHTEEGKALVEEMEIQFDGSLVKRYEGQGVDIYQTAINVGAREVVHFLRSLRDGKEVDNP